MLCISSVLFVLFKNPMMKSSNFSKKNHQKKFLRKKSKQTPLTELVYWNKHQTMNSTNNLTFSKQISKTHKIQKNHSKRRHQAKRENGRNGHLVITVPASIKENLLLFIFFRIQNVVAKPIKEHIIINKTLDGFT